MVKYKTLTELIPEFLNSGMNILSGEGNEELAPIVVNVENGLTGLKEISDIGVNPPALLIYYEPDTSPFANFDGYSPFRNVLVTIFGIASNSDSLQAGIDAIELCDRAENLIWGIDGNMSSGLRDYINSSEDQADTNGTSIDFGEKVTFDDYYPDFAAAYFTIKVTTAKLSTS